MRSFTSPTQPIGQSTPRQSPDRRRFLTGLGKTGLAGILLCGRAPGFVRAETRAGSNKLGLALIGLGGYASQTVVQEIAACKNVRLAGAVTGDAAKGKEWAAKHGFPVENIFGYEDFDKLARCSDIDFVHVITPNSLHEQHTIKAAAAGKHVLCEKPMATSVRAAARMIAACKRAGVLLGIDYRLHWEPHHLKMVDLARSNAHGAIKAIYAEFSWLRREGVKPWLLDQHIAGGGAFFDTGVYTIQAGCYLTGEDPVRVTATPTTFRAEYPRNIEEMMCVNVEFPGGVIMQATASYAVSQHELRVKSEGGVYSCDGFKLGDRRGATFAQSVGGAPSAKVVRLPDGSTYKAEDTLQVAVVLDAFADSISNHTPFKAPGEMGLRDVRVLEAVVRSARSRRTVSV